MPIPIHSKHSAEPWRLWKLLLSLCLVAGVILRVVNLEQKLYWYDEAFTMLRISGHTEAEAVQAIPPNQVISVTQLAPYQKRDQKHGERGLIEAVSQTVRGLAEEEPQHTPLYYGLARLWAELFGDSISAIRSLSVLVSLLALPAMAWLCWELFGSELGAWLGTALLAVSPFQVIYAQEARPTALWTLTILLASAALLRALRLQTARSWGLYGGLFSLNLYAYLFSGLVAVAHASYVLGLERRLSSTLRWFAGIMALSLMLFAPWLLAVAANSAQVDTVTDWLTVESRFGLLGLVKLWGYHLSLPFVDRGTLVLPLPLRLLLLLAHLVVRVSILVAFYRLWRYAPLRVWLFVTSLTLVPALMLTLPDLIAGGKRSTVPRYLVPVYIGFELALTGLLSGQLLAQSTQFKQRWRGYLWSGVTLLILAAGLLSSTAIAQSDTWWSKIHNQNVPVLAQQVNQTKRPLIISDAELGDLWSLSHYLDPQVKLLLRPKCYACSFNRDLADQPYLPPIPAGFSDVFLYNPRPSERWLSQLQQAPYPIKPLSEGFENWFWQIPQTGKPLGKPLDPPPA